MDQESFEPAERLFEYIGRMNSDKMTFIGREKETRKIIRALERGDNVIVKGKYGIGRTTMVRHIAESIPEQFRFLFVDFSKTPGQVCQELLAALFPQKKYRRDDRQHDRYKSMRFRIANRELPDKRQHVIVLDNIGRLTRQKLALIRYLGWEKRFRFIAIAERYLPDAELLLLRAELMPAEVLTLSYLDAKNTGELLHQVSEVNKFEWSEKHIDDLAEATRGYPLGIRETAEREFKRRRGKNIPGTS